MIYGHESALCLMQMLHAIEYFKFRIFDCYTITLSLKWYQSHLSHDLHAKRFIIASVVIVCFQFCKCCNFEHVSDCKSCDHLILLCVVLYAKILIINVIIKYMHGYKCCGLCCKCCGVKKCMILVYCSGNTAWYTPVYLAVCLHFEAQQGNTARIHGRVLWPCSLLPQNFKNLILSSFCCFHTQDSFWTIF